MTRRLVLIGLLVVLAGALAGCLGSTEDEQTPDENDPLQRPDETAIADADPFELFLCEDGYRLPPAATEAVDRCNHRVTKPLVEPGRLDVVSQHGPANEVEIAVNPTNPLHAAGGAKDYTVSYVSDHAECGEYTVWMGTYATQDGGLTWGNDLMRGFPGDDRSSPLTGQDCNTDPVLEYDENGTLWYSGLNYRGAREDQSTVQNPTTGDDVFSGSQLYFARSSDDGRSYDAINFASSGDNQAIFNDKQWFAVQPGGEHMIATWSRFYALAADEIVYTESLDGGQTWTPARTLRPGTDTGGTPDGLAAPALGQFSMPRYVSGASPDDGTRDLAVIWWNGTHTLYAEGFLTSAGVEFGPVQSTFPVNSLSSEEGRDGTGPTEFRLSTYPVLAVDRSGGECDGQRYVIWADQPGEVNTDVDVLVRSSTDGLTWSEPSRVHDVETNDQLMPWIDVGPEGGVHAMWYDKRNDPDNVEMDVYYAYSPDCGETWTDDVRVTETSFDGDEAHHQNGNPFIGDYISLDATNESVHLMWADTRHTGEPGRQAGSDVYSATLLRDAGAMDTFDEVFENAPTR